MIILVYPVEGSFVGLALSQIMGLIGVLQFGIRQTAGAINQLTSVERVLQYTKLETEGPFETPQGKSFVGCFSRRFTSRKYDD